MWFVVARPKLKHDKFGLVSHSFFWNDTTMGWEEIVATPYRTKFEAEVRAAVAVIHHPALIGSVGIETLDEILDRFYGKGERRETPSRGLQQDSGPEGPHP